MKVLIARDEFGISIWKEGTKLEIRKVGPRKNIEVWIPRHYFPSRRKLFSQRKVKRYFPDLFNSIKLGEKREGEMLIVFNSVKRFFEET